MEEYLEIYDKDKKKTGIVISRSEEKQIKKNQYILVVGLLVQNDEDKFMVQLTSKEKGDVFAIPGGHVTYGEDSRSAIVRELSEEQGLNIDKEKISFLKEIVIHDKVFFDIYYLKANYDKKDMILQKEEVEDVFWMTADEIFNAANQGKVRNSTLEVVKYFINNK